MPEFNFFSPEFINILWRIGIAVLILVGGWLLALILAALTRTVLQRTAIDDRLATRAGLDRSKINVEDIAGKAVFWLVMVFVLVAVFQALQLTAVIIPLTRLLEEVFIFIPKLLGAGLLFILAWLIATFLRFAVSRGLAAIRLDDRLAGQAGLETTARVPLSQTLADIIYWGVFLLFLPAIIGALELEGLLAPIQNLVNELVTYLPNILGAGLILLFGWLIARIVRQIVTNLLVALGVDGLGTRVGLTTLAGGQSLSNIIGTIVYVLILIPVLIAALTELDIEAISAPAILMLTTLLNAIPLIFGAMIILAVAYFIGRLVATLVTSLLTAVGFNRLLSYIGWTRTPAPGQRTPAEIVGYLVLIGIMLFAVIEAAETLGFTFIATLISGFLIFAVQVLLGIIVLALGLYLANLARSIIASTSNQYSHLLSQLAYAAIVILAAAMALRQMNIAEDIVNLAFGLTLGAIAVAAALAFGLGSRQIAAREVEKLLSQVRSAPEYHEPATLPPPAPAPASTD
jgi:hypothetical protein